MFKRLSLLLVIALIVAAVWWRLGNGQAPTIASQAAMPALGRDSLAAKPESIKGAPPQSATSGPVTSVLGSEVSYSGTPLEAKAIAEAHSKGRNAIGRTAVLDTTAVDLKQLNRGQAVTIPLPGGGEVKGVVNLVQTSPDGTVRVGGSLADNQGSFSLAQTTEGLAGRVLVRSQELAYVMIPSTRNRSQLTESALSDIICFPFEKDAAVRERQSAARPPRQSSAPELRSRPGAGAVLYLVFDGATVTDPDWNDGNTINAAASNLNSAEITEVWNRVKEDYLPFNINVTTVASDYAAAAVNRRSRIIITPTDAWYPDAGGVAYTESFAGKTLYGFNSDIPAWVFNTTVNGVAEAISHELGHTLGLDHDGRTSPVEEYYEGHGSGATSWAPIMGTGYYVNVVQWSKGEYPNANNHEDDVAIIAGAISTTFASAHGYTLFNNTGYIADDVGDNLATAKASNLSSGTVSESGMISSAADVDFYSFTLVAGKQVTVTGQPVSDYAKQANLDLALELQNSSGGVLALANPDGELGAVVTRTLGVGTYYVKVTGVGRSASGGDYGYTNYGSIGAYSLQVTAVSVVPVVNSPTTASIGVANLFSYTITATNGPTSFNATGLPAGLSVDTSTGVVSGRPQVTGVFTIGLAATNDTGTGNGTLSLTVDSAAPAIVSQTRTRQLLVPGGGAILSVSGFSANGSITYQWMHNGLPVAGATSSSLSLSTVGYGDSGAYWLVLNNNVGVTRSAPIFVVVAPTTTQVRAWGQSAANATGVPAGLTDATAISAGRLFTSMALRRDGTVAAWGYNSAGQTNVPAGLADVVAIASGEVHCLALKNDGTVVGWGNSSASQLNIPSGLTDVVAIGVGSQHSVALRTDGTVLAWGTPADNTTTVPSGLSGVVAIAAGGYHTLALRNDGTVVAWGYNASGQVTVPAGLSGVVAISAGYAHSLALKSDGTVVAWGYTGDGAATGPGGLSSVNAVSGGQQHTLILKNDGTVQGWGLSSSGQIDPPAGGLDAVFAISAGSNYNLALRNPVGDVVPHFTAYPQSQTKAETQAAVFSVGVSGSGPFSYQWRKGGNAIPGATASTLTLKNLTFADAGSYDVIVTNNVGPATSNAAVLIINPLPVVTLGSSTRQLLALGASLSLGVTATGTGTLSYQWWHNGRPVAGSTGNIFATSGVQLADGGYYFVDVTDNYGTRRSAPLFVVIKTPNPQIVAWGRNAENQISIPAGTTDAVAVAAGNVHSLILKADGTVLAIGDNYFGQTTIPSGLNGVVAIAAGNGHSLALKADGTVLGWGNGSASAVPAGLSGIVAIAGGGNHSLALKADGTVVAWGMNNNGQITVPEGLTNVVAIAGGANHSLALKANGTVVAWGGNSFGQSSVDSVLTTAVAISASDVFSLVLKSDGTVAFWGTPKFFSEPTRSPPTGLNNVTVIAAGSGGSLALKSNGTVVGWGTNYYYGEIIIPPDLSAVFAIAKGMDHSLAITDAAASMILPAITVQPSSQATLIGLGATFTVAANGTPAPTYQWQRLATGSGVWTNLIEGGIYSGTTTTSLTVAGALIAMSGDQFRCVAMNSGGSVVSNAAALTVTVLTGARIWTDFNGDRKSDLLWRNTSSNDYAAWLMNGATMSGSASYGLPAEWGVIKVADFDGDGKSDLVWRNSITGAVVLWQMNGTTIASSTWIYDSGTDWTAEVFADFNGDGKTDILWHNTVNGQYAIWLMNGGTVASGSGFSITAGWSIAKAADFNGDGKTDLLWRNASTGGVVMWLQDGTTTASSTWIYDSGIDWAFRLFADFNGDGKTDILWHNTVTDQYAFWLMDGGTVAGASGFSIAAGWHVTHAADFSGDSKADLIWRNDTSGGVVMWLQDGTTTTSTAWIYDSGTDWEIAATKDFDGDGKADLLWHNTVTGEYAFWLMNGAATTSASGFSLPAGWALDQ